MHCNTILFLLTLALPAAISAQKNGQSYCDFRKKAPNKDKCFDIKDNGVKSSEYYKRTEWTSGNCRVKVSGQVTGSGPSISGDEVKKAIQDIINVCDAGFKYVNDVRIDVNICTIGLGFGLSKDRECAGPLQRINGFTKRDTIDTGSERRHLTDVSPVQSGNHIISRATEPFPGIICGGGPGAAAINDCKEAAEEIKKMKRLDLPYIRDNAGCQVQVWPTTRNKRSIETSHVSYSIVEDLDICADATKKIVGMISNYNGYDYHFFFGMFCGALNSGRPGSCWPGGK
jgi:hypothetical protein